MIADQDSRSDAFLKVTPSIVPRSTRRRSLPAPASGRISAVMEERLASIETHMEHVREDVSGLKADVRELRSDFGGLRADLGDVRIDLAKLATRVDHLPDKGFIVRATLGALMLATAFAGVISFFAARFTAA